MNYTTQSSCPSHIPDLFVAAMREVVCNVSSSSQPSPLACAFPAAVWRLRRPITASISSTIKPSESGTIDHVPGYTSAAGRNAGAGLPSASACRASASKSYRRRPSGGAPTPFLQAKLLAFLSLLLDLLHLYRLYLYLVLNLTSSTRHDRHGRLYTERGYASRAVSPSEVRCSGREGGASKVSDCQR